MINSGPETEGSAAQEAEVRRVVGSGAVGAVVLAGIATAIVVTIWLAFYLFVFTPRAMP